MTPRISTISSSVQCCLSAAAISGVTPFGTLAAVWDYHRSPLFTDAEKAAFDFALAAASVPNAVTPEIGAALKQHWTDDEIVEILGVIALFGFLNRWNDSMATTLEGIGISAGERNMVSKGWTAGKHRTAGAK